MHHESQARQSKRISRARSEAHASVQSGEAATVSKARSEGAASSRTGPQNSQRVKQARSANSSRSLSEAGGAVHVEAEEVASDKLTQETLESIQESTKQDEEDANAKAAEEAEVQPDAEVTTNATNEAKVEVNHEVELEITIAKTDEEQLETIAKIDEQRKICKEEEAAATKAEESKISREDAATTRAEEAAARLADELHADEAGDRIAQIGKLKAAVRKFDLKGKRTGLDMNQFAFSHNRSTGRSTGRVMTPVPSRSGTQIGASSTPSRRSMLFSFVEHSSSLQQQLSSLVHMFSRTSDRTLLTNRTYSDTSTARALTAKVHRQLTFQNEDILRGTRVVEALHSFGTLFASSNGDEETYELSEVVPQIDSFISHNWCVRRSLKFLALVTHFNFVPALLIAIASMSIVGILTACDTLPVLERTHATILFHQVKDRSGVFTQITTAPIFVCVLFFWHELGRLVRWPCPFVFLDKTCIHQTDPSLKKQGINQLGAFLAKSSTMVIIYTDVYLQKLWTVYELASFLCLNSIWRLHLIPSLFGPFVLSLVGIFYVADLAHFFTTIYGWWLLKFLTLGIGLRMWAHQEAAMHRRICQFQIYHAMVSCEDDRPLIHNNVADLMRHFNIATKEASEEEALSAFNGLIRQELSDAIDGACGVAALPYRWLVVLSGLTIVPSEIDKFGALCATEGTSVRDTFLFLSCTLCISIGIVPLVLAAVGQLCHCRLNGGLLSDCVLIFLASIVGTFSAEVCIGAFQVMAKRARFQTLALLAVLMLELFIMAASCLVFQRPANRCFREVRSGLDGDARGSLTAPSGRERSQSPESAEGFFQRSESTERSSRKDTE